MSPAAAVQVLGEDRLALTMAAAAADMQHLDRAQAATGRTIQLRAATKAPKRTGRLASSIRAKASGDTVAVGSSLVYAPVIHNGWPAHHIRAHPFLTPVPEETEPVWRPYYVAEVRAVLEQVKGV